MVYKPTLAAAFVLVCVTSAFGQQQQTQPEGQSKPQTQTETQGQGQPGTKGTTSGTGSQGGAQASSQAGNLTQADRNFFTRAAADGHKEVELAQLAQQKAATPTVRTLAERIQKDHQQANQELTTLAQQKGVNLPAAHNHKAEVAKFQKLEGAAFDRTYSSMMVQEHTNAIALFERASKSKDADVRAFAEKTLPTLRDHLRMSKEAQGATTSTSGTKPTGAKPSGAKPASPSEGTQK